MYFGWFYLDWTLVFMVPGLLLGLWAQWLINSRFKRYSKVRARSGVSGAQLAAALLADAGLGDVEIRVVGGRLSDHYDPRRRCLSLSTEVAHSASVAALGVAAHETGHAVQHARGYFPLHLRNAVVPATKLGSWLFIPLFIAGLIFASEPLVWIGIGLFAIVIFFQLITLPVEFNASRRALTLLREGAYLDGGELEGARKVLGAAAMTYVASLVTSLLVVLRLLFISGVLRR